MSACVCVCVCVCARARKVIAGHLIFYRYFPFIFLPFLNDLVLIFGRVYICSAVVFLSIGQVGAVGALIAGRTCSPRLAE